MTRKPESYEELTRLISSLLEGRLSVEERATLEVLLEADPQARRLYMQMIDQEIELSCLLVPAGARESRTILPLLEPAESAAPARGRRPRWKLAAAAAVLLMGTALALVISRDRFDGKPVAAPRSAITLAANTWSEDFEQGLARGWMGALVTNGLPPGSKHGVAAIIKRYPAGEPAYVVQLPEDWGQGLFALTTGSTLHVTYRLNNPTYVNIFMHTIPAGSGDYEMYQLRPGRFPGRIGEWQTASIPLSLFVRKVVVQPGRPPEFAGGPPGAGERVTTLAFSSLNPLDIVIDRVWVTPSGPAREEIVPLAP